MVQITITISSTNDSLIQELFTASERGENEGMTLRTANGNFFVDGFNVEFTDDVDQSGGTDEMFNCH